MNRPVTLPLLVIFATFTLVTTSSCSHAPARRLAAAGSGDPCGSLFSAPADLDLFVRGIDVANMTERMDGRSSFWFAQMALMPEAFELPYELGSYPGNRFDTLYVDRSGPVLRAWLGYKLAQRGPRTEVPVSEFREIKDADTLANLQEWVAKRDLPESELPRVVQDFEQARAEFARTFGKWRMDQELLSDSPHRHTSELKSAIDEIGRIRGPQATNFLVDLLSAPENGIRYEAFQLLAQRPLTNEHLPALIRAQKNWRAYLLHERRPGRELSPEEFARRVSYANWYGAESFGSFFRDNETRKPDPNFHSYTVIKGPALPTQLIARIGTKESRQQIIASVDDPAVALQAAQALLILRRDLTNDDLPVFLAHVPQDARVAELVIWMSMGEIHTPEAMAALLSLFKHPSEAVRSQAVYALDNPQMPRPEIATLKQMLEKPWEFPYHYPFADLLGRREDLENDPASIELLVSILFSNAQDAEFAPMTAAMHLWRPLANFHGNAAKAPIVDEIFRQLEPAIQRAGKAQLPLFVEILEFGMEYPQARPLLLQVQQKVLAARPSDPKLLKRIEDALAKP